jgi:hypothetical protein
MAEGIVLSLAAEKRELKRQNKITSGNLSTASVTSTGRVESPLNITTGVSHGVITRLSNLSINRLQRALRAVPDDSKALVALADAYQTLAVASSRQGFGEEADKAYKMFRNLYIAPFAKCSRIGLSYKGFLLYVSNLSMKYIAF